MAAAVEIVELRLGDRVVDVDRREQQLPRLHHLVEPVHTGRRLLGDSLDARSDRREEGRVVGEDRATTLEEHTPLLRVVLVGLGHGTCLLELEALVHEHGGVAAVVEDQVGTATVRPAEQLLGRPPVLLQRLALPSEHRRARRGVHRAVGTDGDSGRGVVLG